MRHSALYTLGFAAVVCLVCSVLVTASTVSLKARQERNAVLDKQGKILTVAGLTEPGQTLSPSEVQEKYKRFVRMRLVDMETGDYAPDEETLAKTYDMETAMADPAQNEAAPPNPAQVKRVPTYAPIYEVLDANDKVAALVIPVQGKGLWSTLYGYLALKNDVKTIQGLTFYKHGETPGLGGEIDNPKWKALWPGREAYDDKFDVRIHVIKGAAGPAKEAPYEVDGLSGATLTSRGVTFLLQFWLGENGYLPFLKKFSGVAT